ncbi:hypothetical protein FSP39_003461 [Pinctada imbricata]|uniref:CARD domain-containing protein n=1 Tax=Pinctada imbricata TaxID=66713 RepID=A0AA88XQ55_PINIB|nr:hypothetical protein FSP39_003461 [Pinctada imbricata]
MMDDYQVRAIDIHTKDLESKGLITSHVLKVLPRNTRTEIEKIKDHQQGKKLRKFLDALKKTKDGFNLLLKGLLKEKHHNGHLVEKLQQKAKECQKAELNNKNQNAPSRENLIPQSDLSKVYEELAGAALGKCQIPPEKVTVESFGAVVDELSHCRRLLTGKDGKATGNSSLSSLITTRDQNQQNEREKDSNEKLGEIEALKEKLEEERNEKRRLQEEKEKIEIQNERKINERVREIMRKKLLAPPGLDGDFMTDPNPEGSTDTESDYEDDDDISDDSTDDRVEQLIDLDHVRLGGSSSIPTGNITIKKVQIKAHNVSFGVRPTIANLHKE